MYVLITFINKKFPQQIYPQKMSSKNLFYLLFLECYNLIIIKYFSNCYLRFYILYNLSYKPELIDAVEAITSIEIFILLF